MSSMTRISLYGLAFLASTVVTGSVPLAAQADAVDRARQSMVASVPSQIGQAVERWKLLTSNDRMGFDAYAGFALAYPEFPRMDVIRANAEESLSKAARPVPKRWWPISTATRRRPILRGRAMPSRSPGSSGPKRSRPRGPPGAAET